MAKNTKNTELALDSNTSSSTEEAVYQNKGAIIPQAKFVEEDFEALANEGFENADSESYTIPFLSVIQDGSPQTKKTRAEYIPEAEEGMIFNSVSEELFDSEEGLYIVPVHFDRKYIKWVPRKLGGGFLGEIEVTDPLVDQGKREGGKLILEDGNELADTRKHYVLAVNPETETFTFALMSLASTQIKKSKQLMSRLNSIKLKGKKGLFTPPTRANLVHVSTVPESNDQGTWYSWKFNEIRQLDLDNEFESTLFKVAGEFRDALLKGDLKEQQPDSSTVMQQEEDDDVGY